MAVLTKQNGSSLGGMTAGAGSTLIMRDQFDRAGDDRITRPSVIWGVGTGIAALGAGMFMEPRNYGMPQYLDSALQAYGFSALTAGAFSAFAPKGSTQVATPSLRG